MENSFIFNEFSYRNKLAFLFSTCFEAQIKKSTIIEHEKDEKDAIQNAFLKLYLKAGTHAKQIIMGDNEQAKAYIKKVIFNSYLDLLKEKEKKPTTEFTESAKQEYDRLATDHIINDNINNDLDKLDNFVKMKVPLNKNDKKLWELIAGGESAKKILSKMGYKDMRQLTQHKHVLFNKFKAYIEKYNFRLDD
jgi:hypothetical protein